jgi:alkylation response protein AidB-like acyl-CoA dehydrogenase
MTLVFSPEQEELRRTVRSFLAAASPESEVRRLMETETGYDPATWARMGTELGLQGIHIPEEYGGSGFSFVELCLILEEMGAALLSAPFLASAVLASTALLESGDEAAKKELLPGLASGETIGTLAYLGAEGRPDSRVTATRTDSGFVINGTKGFVLDGAAADLILVTAGGSLFAVAKDAVEATALPVMDQTRKQAQLRFTDAPGRLIGSEGTADGLLERVLQFACVAVVNESAGGARAVLDQAVSYAKERFQFGRQIGSFQAIKHKCANMLVDVEGSKSAAYHAAELAASGASPDELAIAASLAKSYVGEAYYHAAAENIQIHGGIGFTWEHPAHLYFKRAKSSELLFGDPLSHRTLLAERFGLTA